MAIIQPFSFQFCTAFRERKQLADKTNEIIEVLNSADLENLPTEIEELDAKVEELDAKVEELDAKVEDYNTTQSQNLLNLSDYVDAERVIIVNRLNAIEEDTEEIKSDIEQIEENINEVKTNIENWIMLTNSSDFRYLISDDHIVNKDMIIRIGSDGYNNITVDKTIYLPKGFKFKDTNNSINLDFTDLSNFKLYSIKINESDISDLSNTVSINVENWDLRNSIADDENITFSKISLDNQTPFLVIYVRGE